MKFRRSLHKFLCFFDIFYTSNFDMSCMGIWVPVYDTRGAYTIFHIKFDSEVKYTKCLTRCKIRARASVYIQHSYVYIRLLTDSGI